MSLLVHEQATRAAWDDFCIDLTARLATTRRPRARRDIRGWMHRPSDDTTETGIDMLRDANAIATLAVKDLSVAARFYEETLGLSRAGGEGDEVIIYASGDTTINVYRSSFAGTNKGTALTWSVADVDEVVRTLKSKGVKFEHYDMTGTRREGDVHVAGDIKVAWFKDPDGNILSVVNR